MAEYSVDFKSAVEKDFTSIPKRALKKILKRIALLRGDPRPAGCEKPSGQERYRIRQGRYRIIYTIQDQILTVCVVKAGHRKDVYR